MRTTGIFRWCLTLPGGEKAALVEASVLASEGVHPSKVAGLQRAVKALQTGDRFQALAALDDLNGPQPAQLGADDHAADDNGAAPDIGTGAAAIVGRNAKGAISAIRDIEDLELAREVLEAERAGSDRITVVEAAQRQVDSLGE